MKKIIYILFFGFFCISCNKTKTEFETKIANGYWLIYWEPKRQINDNYIRSSCDKYDNDGIARVYLFRKNGSVDSADNERYTQFDSKWIYSSRDSIFQFVGKNNSIELKFVKIEKDTIFLKFKEAFSPYKKDDIVYLVKYTPRSVPILVGDSVIRFR